MSLATRINRWCDRHFAALGVLVMLAILGFGAWLDRDLIAADLDGQQIGPMQLHDGQMWERQRAAERLAERDERERIARMAYAQGLRDGATGAVALHRGQAGFATAQACISTTQACRDLGMPTR